MPVFSHKRCLIDSILLLLLAVCGTGLLLWSEAVSAVMVKTVYLCTQVLLPSLFPFFVLSSLLISSGIVQRIAPHLERMTQYLFGLPGSCAAAVLLGAVGGYPVGAKTAASLYQQGVCRKEDALTALRFCNNAGPAFLISAVGSGLLGDKRLGILLYGLHLISSMLIGLLFRENKNVVKLYNITDKKPPNTSLTSDFLQAVTGSFSAFLNVCAFVLLFSVIICLLKQLPLLSRLPPLFQGLLSGVLELTSGTAVLAASPLPKRCLLTVLSFLCGWGGLSVQLQTISFLQEADLPYREYLGFKLLHGGLAALLTFLLYR